MREIAKYIVSCNGAKFDHADKNIKSLVLDYHPGCKTKNITIDLKKFTNDIYHLEDRLKDLLVIAGYVFSADRKTYRGDKYDLEYHSWSREFHFHIKVRDYTFWEREDVKSLLNNALVFMTGDHKYNFSFYEGAEDFPEDIFDNDNFRIDHPDDLKVMLFSGGLDSLAGAIELLETTNSEICLVSHQSGQTGIIRNHNIVFDAINNIYPDRCKHYRYHCGFDHCESNDESQRTRAFLYTATAFAIAKTYNQDKIYVYENGVVSLNFAETQDLMNGRASRTTHPKTLGLLEQLFSKISDSKFTIENPFLFKTKTEVVEVLKNYNKLSLLNKSVSCSVTRNHPTKVPHCGVCSQCIDRKFAVHAAEVENYEGKDFYAFDFLSEDIVKEEIKKSLTEYIKIAQSYCENDINNFFLYRGPELIEIDEFLDGKDEEERIGKVFDLCRRHSKQIESAINNMRKKYDSPFAKLKPKSFFYSILGLREYQKSSQTNETQHKNKSEDELKRDNEMLTNELGNAHQMIKRYNKVKYAKIDYTKYPYNKVAQIADQTRKINKKLNFKKIAEQLGVSDKTAHSICKFHSIT